MTASPPLRLLNRADVIAAGGADIDAAMRDVLIALAALRAGRAEMPPETSVSLGPAGMTQTRAYALPARIAEDAGVKWAAHRPPAQDGAPTTASITVVNDAMNGLPVGIVESGLLTATRTAAVSALVLQCCAAVPLRHVTVLGAGAQANAHLRMLARAFPALSSVTLWNRTHRRARALADDISGIAPWPIAAAPDLSAAIETADAVITCTNAATPFLGPDSVRPGRTLLQIGYHEVSFEAIDRADVVLVDAWGEFRLTSAKSLFQMHRAGRFAAATISADLAQLVLDGWRPTAGASVYFSSFGLNIFDIALAARVLHTAARDGIGTQVSLS